MQPKHRQLRQAGKADYQEPTTHRAPTLLVLDQGDGKGDMAGGLVQRRMLLHLLWLQWHLASSGMMHAALVAPAGLDRLMMRDRA
jgi:hypothetical protein